MGNDRPGFPPFGHSIALSRPMMESLAPVVERRTDVGLLTPCSGGGGIGRRVSGATAAPACDESGMRSSLPEPVPVQAMHNTEIPTATSWERVISIALRRFACATVMREVETIDLSPIQSPAE
jgi:hypothetical protein